MSAGAVIIIINPPRANRVAEETPPACFQSWTPKGQVTITVEGLDADVLANEVISALYAAAEQICDRRSALTFANLPPSGD